MQILNSTWLIKMLEKSGASPEARILSLFQILADWSTAPNFEKSLLADLEDANEPTLLHAYLLQQAQKTKAAAPNMLAEQIVLLAKISLQTQFATGNSEALYHAKETAKALIQAQCEKEPIALRARFKLNATQAYAGLGFIAVTLIIGSVLLFQQKPVIAASSSNADIAHLSDKVTSDPKLTADMYASLETMRGGDCRFIEALMIPEADKKVYVENVVAGQVPTSLHDQMIAQRYIQKIRCNYTPMLMQNSTN